MWEPSPKVCVEPPDHPSGTSKRARDNSDNPVKSLKYNTLTFMDSANANGSSLVVKGALAKSRICSAIRSYIRHLPTSGGGSSFKSAPSPGLLILKPHTLSAISSRLTDCMQCETCPPMREPGRASGYDRLAGERRRCQVQTPGGSKLSAIPSSSLPSQSFQKGCSATWPGEPASACPVYQSHFLYETRLKR